MTLPPLPIIDGPAGFRAVFDVSRETLGRLEIFHATLAKWNARINLVSRPSMKSVWHRHFADSAQLWRLRPPNARSWLDLGAGAGFPGLVIAVLARETDPALRISLVESDERKAAFLSTVSRALDLQVAVHCRRAEKLSSQGADVVSARALAPLSELLPSLEKHRAGTGIGLFLKGASVHKEIGEAEANGWRFERKLHPSVTHRGAATLEIGAIERV